MGGNEGALAGAEEGREADSGRALAGGVAGGGGAEDVSLGRRDGDGLGVDEGGEVSEGGGEEERLREREGGEGRLGRSGFLCAFTHEDTESMKEKRGVRRKKVGRSDRKNGRNIDGVAAGGLVSILSFVRQRGALKSIRI